MNEEHVLVSKLKEGDYSSFDNLFHKYGDRLYRFVIRIIKSPELAEDIVQDIFVKVWENRHKLESHLSFRSFLFSIAHNETISVLRKMKSDSRYNEYITHFFQSNPGSATPQTELEYSELEQKINDVIGEMPLRRKEIFRMSRTEGLSHREIAKKLDISPKTVENHIAAALKTLRGKLGESGFSGLIFFYLFLL